MQVGGRFKCRMGAGWMQAAGRQQQRRSVQRAKILHPQPSTLNPQPKTLKTQNPNPTPRQGPSSAPAGLRRSPEAIVGVAVGGTVGAAGTVPPFRQVDRVFGRARQEGVLVEESAAEEADRPLGCSEQHMAVRATIHMRASRAIPNAWVAHGC